MLSGIAVQHADNGHSRRGNVGSLPVRSVVLVHSLIAIYGTKVCGFRGGEFEEIEWV